MTQTTPSTSAQGCWKLCPHAPTYDAGLCCGHPDDCTFVSPSSLASDATPAPTSGGWRSVLTGMVDAMSRYGHEVGDGDIPSAHRNLISQAEQLLAGQSSPVTEDAAALAIVRMFKERIERHGNWDEGCFYYGNTSASELQEPLRLATAALSPAPTSGSEGGGDNCLWTDKPCTCGGADCEQVDFGAGLAKPASEPAGGVREALRELLADYTNPNPKRDKGEVWGMLARAEAALSSSAGPAVEADMRRVCEALGFDPGNHHNALKCPYCNPKGLQFAHPAPATVEIIRMCADVALAAGPADYKAKTGQERLPCEREAFIAKSIMALAAEYAALAPATEGRKG